ncbi:MAG: GNAT family N-acetyltransferase, partial [bacterium]
VVRDLELSMDQLWMMFEHKVRKNVKKAQRAGILVEHDEGERLESFLSIYQHTMDRRDAHERYYFPREYFERLHATLPGQFRYFHAIREGSVLSTELVLVSSENVYSFLGGTREDAFEHRPNDILKHAIMDWAVSQGKRHFVLGGGYAPDDGIFRYKLAFAPDGRRPFYVGRRILLPAAYARLVERRTLLRREHEDAPSSSGFFPAYRG